MSEVRELTAACGIYCGACPQYRATSDPNLAQKLAQVLGKKPEEVLCIGCRPKAKRGDDMSGCDVFGCTQDKNVEFCYECSDFPCVKLSPCADRANESPHNMKMYNLVVAEKRGLEALANESRDTWRRYFRGKKIPGKGEAKVE